MDWVSQIKFLRWKTNSRNKSQQASGKRFFLPLFLNTYILFLVFFDDLLSGSTSSQVHHGQRRSSSNYQSNHSRTPGGLSRGCSGPTSGPPTFLVTNCNRSSLGHRLHRNSDTSSLTRSSLNIGKRHDALKNYKRAIMM